MSKRKDNQTSATAAAAPRPPVRAFRSSCPIARTLDLFGDKWTLVIMRDALFFDCRTFADFANCSEKIPTNLLAARLKRLVLIGMLEKVPYQAKPVRYEYRPTSLGYSLQPVLKEILKFGQTHLSD